MRILTFVISIMAFIGLSGVSHANDKAFFDGIQGQWSGPGEIVAGKYKGTKFVCNFDGFSGGTVAGMKIDGSCRVGMFAQPMNASIAYNGKTYLGKFLDGADGEGMDVIGGRVSKGRMIADIKRKDLKGVMVTNLTRKNKMNITISVLVNGKLVPVIGMALDRVGNAEIAKAD